METSPIVSAASSAQSTSAAPSAGGLTEDAGITADFDTFLTLLTSQLRNQDPLNPANSTEFVAQLATFSAVEQQTKTNDLLEQLVAATAPADPLAEAAALIGLQVTAEGAIDFDGDNAVDFQIPAKDGATDAVIAIKNDFGTVVARYEVNGSEASFTWDGTTSEGAQAPPGRYSADVAFRSGETDLGTQSALVSARVTEVRLEDGQQTLVLTNGSEVPSEAIFSISSDVQGDGP
ncbi:MAG: flagellar hook capping FlgD N-terminal domain-containing protein [Pseudomonadota bacterium]